MPEFACGTVPTSISPLVQSLPVTDIAGMRTGADQFHKGWAAQGRSELPCPRLVDPHKRRMNYAIAAHAKVERHLQRF